MLFRSLTNIIGFLFWSYFSDKRAPEACNIQRREVELSIILLKWIIPILNKKWRWISVLFYTPNTKQYKSWWMLTRHSKFQWLRNYIFFKKEINFNIFIYNTSLFLLEELIQEQLRFGVNAPFLYPLKTSENLSVFWYFQGVEKGCAGNKRFNRIRILWHEIDNFNPLVPRIHLKVLT